MKPIMIIVIGLFLCWTPLLLQAPPVPFPSAPQRSFNQHAQTIYQQLEGVPPQFDVFKKGLMGYYVLKQQKKLSQQALLTLIDFSLPSDQKRFWVIQLDSPAIIYYHLVAHGKYTGQLNATSFSNKVGSKKSSLGFFVTGKIYTGKHGLSLRLNGLDPFYNSNAKKRNIVIHGARYVSQSFIKKYGRLGRSFGCPALPKGEHKAVIRTIANGTSLFCYYPDSTYFSRSSWLDSTKALQYLNAKE